MKTETVTQVYLRADEGMYLTNGESVVRTVVLPAAADPAAWHEITEAEAEKILNSEGSEYV